MLQASDDLVSDDLVNWTCLSTTCTTTALTDVTDTPALAVTNRFYRVLWTH